MDHSEVSRVVAAFDRQRLQVGRELRGWSQVQLAREASGLTPAALSQFENGHSRPSPATLTRIASSLRLPVTFFARQSGHTVAAPDAFFRSLRSTSAAERRRARAISILVHDFALALEDHVILPELDLPLRQRSEDSAAIERAAGNARRHFGLEPGPVDNVVQVLEQHGVIVARLRTNVDRIDAFSMPFIDRPVAILGADKGHRDRSRFDAAHELGHLVLHVGDEAGSKEAEAEAHQFAAAFLMPRGDILAELPRRADWEQLLVLKSKWHVSLAALLKRASTLGTMRPELYTQAMKTMSARHWRNQEPGDLGEPERPVLLTRAVKLADEIGVSLVDLAVDRGLPVEDIREVLEPSRDRRPRVTL